MSQYEPVPGHHWTPLPSFPKAPRSLFLPPARTILRSCFHIIVWLDDSLYWHKNFKLTYWNAKGRLQVSVFLTFKCHLRSGPFPLNVVLIHWLANMWKVYRLWSQRDRCLNSAACKLYDLGHVNDLFWVSVSAFLRWEQLHFMRWLWRLNEVRQAY